MTVSGCTIIREDFHPLQIFNMQTQKIRSRWRILGRLTDLFRTTNCWRSARFWAARADLSMKKPRRNSIAMFMISAKAFTSEFFWRNLSELGLLGNALSHCAIGRTKYPGGTGKADEIYWVDRTGGIRNVLEEILLISFHLNLFIFSSMVSISDTTCR